MQQRVLLQPSARQQTLASPSFHLAHLLVKRYRSQYTCSIALLYKDLISFALYCVRSAVQFQLGKYFLRRQNLQLVYSSNSTCSILFIFSNILHIACRACTPSLSYIILLEFQYEMDSSSYLTNKRLGINYSTRGQRQISRLLKRSLSI